MRRRIGYLVGLIVLLVLMVWGCGKKQAHTEHEYGEWEVVKETTCLENGEQVRVCSCGEKETQIIPMKEHTVVKDAAVEATCFTAGKTEGSHCSVCQTVIKEQKVVEPQHKEYTLGAVGVTCTRAGKGKGIRCSECGAVIQRQKKIRATGHVYKDGKCTKCGEVQPDTGAAILIDQLNEEKESNFITKKAYPGGSTMTFWVNVPEGASWWAVSWTTDNKKIGLYDWAEGNGMRMEVETDSWQKCSVTLPDDNKNYYIYFVGAKGEWKGLELLIDDVVITNAKGKVVGKEDFSNGLDNLFHVVQINPSTSYAVVYEKQICMKHVSVTDKAVAATCEKTGLTQGAHCKTCGKILTEQKVIEATGHHWKNEKCTKCGVRQSDVAAAIFVDQLNEEKESNFITKKAYAGGSTMTFWVKVPKGVSWWAVSWTTDNKKIGLYDWAEGNGIRMEVKAGSWQKCNVTLPDDNKNYYIYFVGAKGEWKGLELLIDDVIITNAKGKVVGKEDFSNGLEKLFNVVRVNPTTQYTVVSEKKICTKHVSVTDKAVAATCTKSGLTQGTHCKSCGKILTEQSLVPATGHTWKNGKCLTCGKKKTNLVAALVVDQLNDSAPMNFITKKAYKGGSIVTFKVYIPKNVSGWAAIGWTTDPAKAGLYEWTNSGQRIQANPGEWTECSVTLPKDSKKYYLYFVGEKGQYKGKELLIDTFKITDANGKVLADDDFDNGIENSLFDIVAVNPTSGASVVYDKTGEDPCKKGHTIVIDKAVKATCTKPGKTAGKHCSVCDTILVAQEEITALGHNYNEKGICTRCGDKIVNRAVSIQIDQLNEANEMNFITRKAYAGGSTVTFKAYVPENTAWWAVSWTTNPADTDLYKWAEGKGTPLSSVYNKWATYSVTLPDDGNSYYIYIAGAKGEWNGKALQIDDVKISNKLGEIVAEDDFNSGMNSGLFKIIETNPTTGKTVVKEIKTGDICLHKNLAQEDNVEATCTEPGLLGRTYCKDCNETIHEATVLEKLGHSFKNGKCERCGEPEHKENKAVSINIDQLNEEQNMNFITRQAYAGGSTVTFKAYVSKSVGWWAVSWTTDPSDTGLYKWTEGKGQSQTSVEDSWATYTVTLPDDSNSYYIYIVGAKGEWNGKELLIDDVKITSKSGETLAEDNFNGELKDSIFNLITVNPTTEKTVISQVKVKEPNYAAAINIDVLNEETNMNFITKKAYAGGSTVTFKAYVPKSVGWWAVSWTTDPSDTGLYKWTEGKGKSQTSVEDSWATYTVTLPDDGNSYYIYIVGAKGEWNGKQLLIDDVKITSKSDETLAEENFSGEFEDSIFNILTGDNNMIIDKVTVKEENYAAAIKVDVLNEDKNMNFITQNAYAGGSTITFKAYVPKSVGWWAVSWTTDPSDTDLYKWTEGKGQSQTSVEDSWATYTVTLPDDGNSYYIYIVGAKGEWNGNQLLIDDVKITSKDGETLAEEDFSGEFKDSIFNILTGDNNMIIDKVTVKE